MADNIPVQYQGRTLKADLVTLVASSQAAQLFAADLDTDGGLVPTWKAHSFTYDTSGNLKTDTVQDGAAKWVRTYEWGNGVQLGDSGWVRQ